MYLTSIRQSVIRPISLEIAEVTIYAQQLVTFSQDKQYYRYFTRPMNEVFDSNAHMYPT